MVKQFGKKARPPVRREQFDLNVFRADEPETHRFQIVAVLDAGGLSSVVVTTRRDREMALPATLQVIRKMLDNTDGTPAGWEPLPLTRRSVAERERVKKAAEATHLAGQVVWPEQVSEVPEESPEIQTHLDEVVFRAPYGLEKGNLLPMARSGEFLAPEAGSSRRRWDALLEDDDVTLEAGDLMAVFEWAVGVASGRPTEMSS
jgi:hypothetical protein